MILFRRILSSSAVVVVMFFMTVVSIAGVIERVAAIVNDDVVLESELEEAIVTYKKNENFIDISDNVSGAFLKQMRDRTLALLIDEKLVEQAVNSSGVTVTSEEVDAVIEHIKDLNKHYELEDTLSMEEFRRDLAKKILKSKFIEGHIYSRVVISEDEIKAYYDDNLEVYADELKYYLYTVLIESSADIESEKHETQHAGVLELLNQLNAGVDFDHAAKSCSLNETLSENGYMGYVGAFTKSELSDVVREAIEGLTIGDCTSIMKTEHGTQFFYIKDVSKAKTKPFEMVRNEIYQMLLSEKSELEFVAWLDSLRNCSSIELFGNGLLG